MNIKKEAYRLYQLDWMQRHGYSVTDIRELNSGSAKETYAGYDEFLSCEYKEQDYMEELFQICGNFPDLWAAYILDIGGDADGSEQKKYELIVTETVKKKFIVMADSPEAACEFLEERANADLDMEKDLDDFTRDIRLSGEAGGNAKIDYFAG